jgi:hypothetical protein
MLFFYFSGLQTSWTFCPLGSRSFEITINNTGSINFYSISNVATLLPLQFPLAAIPDVSFEFLFFLNNNLNLLEFRQC